jgi:hypothetical protein
MLNVIIPYRDRAEHLAIFVPYLSAYLDISNIVHRIYVIEQGGGWRPFNRGALLNAGYKIAQEFDTARVRWFAFHDVDMLPITANYSYSEVPTHLVTDASQFPEGVPYESYFGGVTLFNAKDFEDVNGYSNGFWGWGSEDDDMLRRCQQSGLNTVRREGGVFRSLQHERAIDIDLATANYERLTRGTDNTRDGLSTLDFEVIGEPILGPDIYKFTIELL